MTIIKNTATLTTWRKTFEKAFAEGRFREAAAVFDAEGASAGPEILLKAARAHMHADPASALRILLRIDANKRSERVMRDALLTEAFARTRDFTSADDRLEAALELARRMGDGDLLASVAYRGVRRHLLAGEASQARSYLDLMRAGSSRESRVYSAYAEAIILGYEARVLEQAERLTELLRSLDPSSDEFLEIRVWSVHTLAALARELHVPSVIPEIDRHLSGKHWPEDFSPNRFQALRAIGWTKAIQGDYFNAFRHLKAASEAASSTAWNVLLTCDRAHLARCFGEHRWSRVELDQAEQLAEKVDWHATLAEERLALLSLAELYGKLDTARSAMYLARYRELGEIKSPLYYGNDPRRTAYAQFSTGVVELSLGNKNRGLFELREARKIFERYGYNFRVARCLLEELHATANRDLVPRIEEKLRNYPQSWVFGELRATTGASGLSLPPMQKRVFDELCQGKSTAQIAQELNRSAYTVSNHIKAVFKALGVTSRSALVAEAFRRGYIGSGKA